MSSFRSGQSTQKIAKNVIITGISPGTGNTATRIELDSLASSIDGSYDPAQIDIIEGTGAGQSRQIFQYDGTNKYAYINRDWKVIPDSTSKYCIVHHPGNTHVNEGVAQGGSTNTITLNALASAQNNTYLGQMIYLVAGTGQDQARLCIGYNGTTKIATVESNWITQPDTTTMYAVYPFPGFSQAVATVNGANNILVRDVIGNKNDTSAGNSIYSLTHTMEEHIHNSVFIRPDLAPHVTITKATGIWAAYPTPTQIIAANDITSPFDLHFMNLTGITATGGYQIALYSGAPGAEVLIGSYGFARNSVVSQEGTRPILTPLFPANTRISAALSGSMNAQESVNIKLEGHDY